MGNAARKTLAIILCLALLAGGIGTAAYALNADRQEKSPLEKKSSVITTEKPSAMAKDEIVYVLAGAEGNVQKIIVSDWIKNSIGSAVVSDQSELTAVKAVKGNTTYTMNEENMRVWDAQGNDVYYQGNIEKELPVALSVSYKLNGESIAPAELAGKSGDVTIRFDYQNNQYETVEIDGREETMYVPFVMLTGMLLDNDVFTNVEVSNGKLMNDGNRTVIAGIAFPGLQSNLKVEKDRFEIPDYVEIRASVRNFEMTNTVTIATNEIFSRLNTEKMDSVDELADSLDELTDAMNQLMDGSSQLYDGLCTLLDKSQTLISGIDQLADGAAKLKNGAGELSNGAAELAGGAQSLANGLEQLTANSNTLNAGSKQVFDSLLHMANSQLAAAGLTIPDLTVENYAGILNGVIASLDTTNVAKQAQAAALKKVTDAVYAQKEVVTTSVAAAVKEQVSAKVMQTVRENVELQVLDSQGMTKETYEAGIAAGVITKEQQLQITAVINAQMESNAVKSRIEDNINVQMQSQDIQNTISAKTEEQLDLLIEQNMNSPEVQEQITAALERAKSGAASVSALKTQLDSYNAFYTGLNQYTAGVDSAKNGADALNAGAGQLKSGTAQLSAGMNEWYDGVLTLKNGVPALTQGVSQLCDGAMMLSNGLKEFNEQGVQRLIDAVDGDLGGLFARIKATADLSKSYQSFSGLSSTMDGEVKFVYRTESIKLK